MLGIHVYLEDIGGIDEFSYSENCPSAFLGTIALQLSNGLIFFLSLRKPSLAVLFQMFVDSFLSLFPGNRLYSAWIDHELILHDDCNISNSQLWLIWLNQSQLDLIILLEQFLMLSLSLELLSLFFGEIRRQLAVIFFFNSHFLIENLSINFIPVDIVLYMQILQYV